MNSRASSTPALPADGPDVGRQIAMLTAVARRTAHAVLFADARGRIEWVNEGFTRLTGIGVEDAIGKRSTELLQGPDTSPQARASMAAALAARQPFDLVVLHVSKSGRQYWARTEGEPLRDEHGGAAGYMIMQSDVTEQRIAEGREAVLKRIGERLLRCDDEEAAARVVTQAQVRALDVRAAEVWLVEAGRPNLRFIAAAAADADAQDWVDVTKVQPFQRGHEWVRGVGAPGMAWGTGAPCVKTDFWEKDSLGQQSRRAEAARRARIRTVCAVPVLGPEGVVAVIEIGGSHNHPGHERLPSLVEQVAQQFGAFILQHQSRKAFEAMFRHSPDALLVVDDANRVRSGNARAAALFGETRGRPLTTLIADGETLLSMDERTGADGATLHQRTARRLDGSTFSAELTVAATTVTGAPSHIISVRDLTERHRAEESLRRSLEEKTTLVQEVHHRVKNNLQIISSLVSIQAEDVDTEDVRRALQDTARRIQSMALVHQQLYSSDNLARIDFGDYARALCTLLRSSTAPDARVSFEADLVEIPVERAVPAGLILNELVTNAFKHGRSHDGSCTLRVQVRKSSSGFTFSVTDNGPGLSEEPARRGSMGQLLVRALVRQLRATQTISRGSSSERSAGLTITIAVPHEMR